MILSINFTSHYLLYIFIIFCQYIFIQYFTKILGTISHNVPVVCDVFLRPIKKPRSGFRAQKNVPEKNRTKGVARLRFFVGQARYCGRSAYNPVMRSSAVLHIHLTFFAIINKSLSVFVSL
jgi:hypothetical protein